jgi:WD40 repeat protein/predicted Ser/Thr protein kinase
MPVQVGSYRIERLLGRGGMGAVYEAEQDNPRRLVALKVIRPGLAGHDFAKRFTREAHILGRLHHPGIAQVYAAGLADDGQPFFAMELVHGASLNAYANRRRLDVAARIELVARICDAVQHAHEQGVIHRDLKPGNILVDEMGQPKILDFGVARATDADLKSTTAATEVGQVIGTLPYMSPEQVAGDPAAIDPRTDVYSLGVVLFELLCGQLPYTLHGLPLAEAARVIHDRDPDRLGSVNTSLRGDVETIAAKALEKDKQRRYPSAAALAADLRRFLAGQPVTARPASRLYLFRKFARRNKALVGGVAATIVALSVGMVLSLTFAWGEARQRQLAEQQRQEAMREAYQARLAAALSALRDFQTTEAARHLEDAPRALRGWEWHHLHAQLDDSLAVVRGLHTGMYATDFAPAGARVVGFRDDETRGSEGARPRAWDALTGEPLGTLGEPSATRIHATPARGGSLLYREGLVTNHWFIRFLPHGRLLPVTTLERRLVLPPREPNMRAFTPDGSRCAQFYMHGGKEWRCDLFDGNSGKRLAAFEDLPANPGMAMTFSPDGRLLACGGDDGTIRLWDAAGGVPLAVLRGHGDKLTALAFSADGSRLLSGAGDGTLFLWDVVSRRPLLGPLRGHAAEVESVAFHPDRTILASAGTDSAVHLWRARDGESLGALQGHEGNVYRVAFSPDGRLLASAATDGTARVWRPATRSDVCVLRGHSSYVYPVAYSPDGRLLASGGWDNKVRLWDAATGQQLASFEDPDTGMRDRQVVSLAFGPGGDVLAVAAHRKGLVRLWQPSTGRLLATLSGPDRLVVHLAVSPDGNRLVGVSDDNSVRVWDLTTHQELALLPGPQGKWADFSERGSVAFSPDGRFLATPGAHPRDIVLRDARDYEVRATLQGHTREVCSAAFSPDSRRLVTSSLDGSVFVWDTATGRALHRLTGHVGEAFAAVFSPDGTRIATGGRDRLVRLWDPETGDELIRLPGHTNYVFSLAFSPDGRTLASGSGDFTIRLWDTFPLAERWRARESARGRRSIDPWLTH